MYPLGKGVCERKTDICRLRRFLVKNEAYDAEEKAHTSKRVSVIALDNVISKAQFAPRARCGNRIVVVCHFPLQYSAQCTIMSNRLSC